MGLIEPVGSEAMRPNRWMRRAFLAATCIVPVTLTGTSSAQAQDEIAAYAAKGKELFFERVSCWICHGENADGLIGPSLRHGPTPMDIQVQLDSNPQMAVIVAELNPDAEDLVAIASYIRDMTENPVSAAEMTDWRTSLAAMHGDQCCRPMPRYGLRIAIRLVVQIQSFDTVLAEWPQRAKMGSLKRGYDVQLLETFEAGEQVFHPEPDKPVDSVTRTR